MNGERRLDEFINSPCKATMLAFVKSIFTAKVKQRTFRRMQRGSFNWKMANLRWKEDRCDINRRGSPFNCGGCPFFIHEIINSGWGDRTVSICYFVQKFASVYNKLRSISNGDFNQHHWPKALMNDMGFILMGAVKLKNAIELRREEKK